MLTHVKPGYEAKKLSWFLPDSSTPRFYRSHPNLTRKNADNEETYAQLQEKSGFMHFTASMPVAQSFDGDDVPEDWKTYALHAGATRAAGFYKAWSRSSTNTMMIATYNRCYMVMITGDRTPLDVQMYWVLYGNVWYSIATAVTYGELLERSLTYKNKQNLTRTKIKSTEANIKRMTNINKNT